MICLSPWNKIHEWAKQFFYRIHSALQTLTLSGLTKFNKTSDRFERLENVLGQVKIPLDCQILRAYGSAKSFVNYQLSAWIKRWTIQFPGIMQVISYSFFSLHTQFREDVISWLRLNTFRWVFLRKRPFHIYTEKLTFYA